MNEQKEMTARSTSARADDGQSLHVSVNSITNQGENRVYWLLRKVFGSKQIYSLLEQAKQSKQREKCVRNNNFEM